MKKTYPFLRPYCRYMGSYEYYVELELDKLLAADAPADAYASRHGGGFYRLSEMKNPSLKQLLEREAGVTVAEVLGENVA